MSSIIVERNPLGQFVQLPLTERFWAKVDKNGPIPANCPAFDPCWIWQGKISGNGYGHIWLAGKTVGAHRLSYKLLVGAIPSRMTLDHLCRNRACVNPNHLEVVTNRTNLLRGISFSAQNARRTHCPQGHPYDLFNTYVTSKGKRDCRRCWGIAKARYKERLRDRSLAHA